MSDFFNIGLLRLFGLRILTAAPDDEEATPLELVATYCCCDEELTCPERDAWTDDGAAIEALFPDEVVVVVVLLDAPPVDELPITHFILILI